MTTPTKEAADMVEKVKDAIGSAPYPPALHVMGEAHKRDMALAAIRTLAPMVEAKDARIATLEALLKVYATHKGGCRRGIWPDLTPTPPCDCGLSTVLASIKENSRAD